MLEKQNNFKHVQGKYRHCNLHLQYVEFVVHLFKLGKPEMKFHSVCILRRRQLLKGSTVCKLKITFVRGGFCALSRRQLIVYTRDREKNSKNSLLAISTKEIVQICLTEGKCTLRKRTRNKSKNGGWLVKLT